MARASAYYSALQEEGQIITAHSSDGKIFNPQGILTTLGQDLEFDYSLQAQYLTNLARLGLREIDWRRNMVDAEAEYEELQRQAHASPSLTGIVTLFGNLFWNTCVRARAV